MWEVVGSTSLIFMLNNCLININPKDEGFFSSIAYNFFHNKDVVVSLAMLKYTFSIMDLDMV